MTINEFIEELKQKEIEVAFSSGKLKYSGPAENITPELIQNLKKHRESLIKYFWPKEFTNLLPINTNGDKTPLFIIHGDKGNYIISDYLGADQPVYGFFHHGSEGEVIRFKSVKQMTKAYLDQILTVSPEGPYYLIGFSFGGIIAFDIALQLQKANKKVPILVLIDTVSPLATEQIKWHRNFFRIVRKNILGPFRRDLERRIKLLICKSFIFINKPVPVSRRNFYIIETYKKLYIKYKPEKFKGDILLFRTTENESSYDHLGWDSFVDNIKMIHLESDHITIFEKEKSIKTLQMEIWKYLNSYNNSR